VGDRCEDVCDEGAKRLNRKKAEDGAS
jgi:hypothetical protein